MNPEIKSLRPFIGSKNFDVSKSFYISLGFEEKNISNNMSLITLGNFSFYLQDYYAKDWIENTMLFFEIDDVATWFAWLKSLNLDEKYPGASLRPIRKEPWGEECFLLDPAGVLLHFGKFYPQV